MKMNTIKTLLASLALMLASQTLFAGEVCCPDCGKACEAIPITTTVKKHCYKIEYKQICIPGLCIPSFSWFSKKCCESGSCGSPSCSTCTTRPCTPRCGRVKTIKVLKKVEYECKSCGYEWRICNVDSCGNRIEGKKPTEQAASFKGNIPPVPSVLTTASKLFFINPVVLKTKKQNNR